MEVTIGSIILLLISAIIISLYNSIIRARLKVNEASSGIDVLLNKRYDLIENLVEVVKGYTQHEKDILERVTELRNENKRSQREVYHNELLDVEKQVVVIAENYPSLKSDQLYLELMKQMSDVEEQLQATRRFYNSNVSLYNTKITSFPTNLFAKIMKAKERKYFELEKDKK